MTPARALAALVLLGVASRGSDGGSGDFHHGETQKRSFLKHVCSVTPFLCGEKYSAASVNSNARDTANGTIRGRVTLRQPPQEVTPRPNVADLGMPAPQGQADRRRSVVYFENAPRAAFDTREEPRARMDQRNETFVPHVLAIVAGTWVDFPNNDVTYHNVFSLSKAKPFDLGRYAAGRSEGIRFERAGIVRVFCEIHSHMSAYILVFSHRYFAVTDDDGRYRLDNVPPGTYNMIAWHESAQEQSRRVVVSEGGGDLEVNFTLGKR
jgi:plastocyanin